MPSARAILFFLGVLVISCLASALAVHHYDGIKYKAETLAAANEAARAQLKAVDAARLEGERRTAAQMENAKNAQAALIASQSAARQSDDLARQLQQRVDQLLATVRAGYTAAATQRATAISGADPLDLLSQLYSGAENRASELAQYADRAHIAGLECERDYDALTKK